MDADSRTIRDPANILYQLVRLFGLKINQSADAFNNRLENVVASLDGRMDIEGLNREDYPGNRYPHEADETDDDA